MFYQLACRNLGYHFEDQRNLRIAETLAKAMKLHEIEMKSDRVLNLEYLLNSYCRQGAGMITTDEFCRACRDIGIEEKMYRSQELAFFLSCLAPPEFTPNASRQAGLGDTMQYTMSATSQ